MNTQAHLGFWDDTETAEPEGLYNARQEEILQSISEAQDQIYENKDESSASCGLTSKNGPNSLLCQVTFFSHSKTLSNFSKTTRMASLKPIAM